MNQAPTSPAHLTRIMIPFVLSASGAVHRKYSTPFQVFLVIESRVLPDAGKFDAKVRSVAELYLVLLDELVCIFFIGITRVG